MRKSILNLFHFLVLSVFSANAQIELASIFTDDMVLQRDVEVPIWGWINDEATIAVTFEGKQYNAKVDKAGKWQVKLPATPAGGPYQIEVAGKTDKVVLDNILFGDVWVCSGQSNMEWIVENSMYAESEITNAKDTKIRHFKVPRTTSFLPDEKIEGGPWEVASPTTVAQFTAVGYQFAKAIRKEQEVPIGLLNSSWGGSRIEPWMSSTSLGYANPKKTAKAIRKKSAKAVKKKRKELEKKLGKLPQKDAGLMEGKVAWAATNLDESDWKNMELPNLWEDEGLKDVDGVVWFRKSFELTAEEVKQGITLHLGKIDDSDKSYLNGTLIGEMTAKHNAERQYKVAPENLIAGKNVISIRVEDTGGGGGIYGSADQLFVATKDRKIQLAGMWKYRLGVVSLNVGQRLNQTPVILYNKMIHPILDFPIKGVIWYQGESNANEASAYVYRDLFKTMITDWRNRWGVGDFPFLYVQLANFMQAESAPTESNWAMLRESQSAVLELPNTAQAVIIDIGEAADIHPRNKHDVGYRLALGARHLAYGENDLVYSGPQYRSMKKDGNKIRLQFDHVGSGLQAKGGELLEFAIAGADKQFVWAKAEIQGEEIVVWSEKISDPVAVRYAWANNPAKANLYNKEGLPASPFRTDEW